MGVAKCWAKEKIEANVKCSSNCVPYNSRGKFNLLCQRCLANFRQQKRRCSFKEMAISKKCQSCELQAWAQWDDTCMMQCSNMFDDSQGGLDFKPACRECNDVVYKKLNECRGN